MNLEIDTEGRVASLLIMLGFRELEPRVPREADGGVTLALTEQPPILKGAHVTTTLYFLVTFGEGIPKDVAVGLFSAWLYDRLKPTNARTVRINMREARINQREIKKLIEEEIKIEE